MFYLLKQEGKFSGAGAYLYLDEVPNIKFGQKNFKQILESNPELQKAFANACYELLSKFLSDTRAIRAEENNAYSNITDMINSMGNSDIA